MTRTLPILLILGGSVLSSAEQNQTIPSPQTVNGTVATFEVASIKPNKGATGSSVLGVPSRGPVVATNYPTLWLIRYAYGLKNLYQIAGNPSWLYSERFDIRALPPEDAAREQLPLMMQTLLADRFKLRTDWETREQPIYALVLARADGKLGASLKPSKHDCASFLAGGGRAYQKDSPRDEQGRMLCGGGAIIPTGTSPSIIGGAPLSELVTWLETRAGVDRPVVDQTGLAGNFDAAITFLRAGRARSALDSSDEVAPDIYRAVQQQLGLKLEPRKAPARILVIDSVERPTPD